MNLNKINCLLASKFKVLDPDSTGSVKLKEKGQYEFEVTSLPANAKLIELPTSQEGFFNDGYIKICDYLIFIPQNRRNKEIKVIFCELKSNGNEDTRCEGEQQIKSTFPILEYICSGLDVHFNEIWKIKSHKVILEKSGDGENRRISKSRIRRKKSDIAHIRSGGYKVITGASQLPASKLYDHST